MIKLFGGFIASLCMLAMTACAGLGIDSSRLDTTNKQLAAYAGEIAALVELTDELSARQVIDSQTTINVLDRLQQANDIVRSATESVALNGDPRLADNALDRVQVLVDIALDLLVDFGLGDSASNDAEREARTLAINKVRTQGRQAALYAFAA